MERRELVVVSGASTGMGAAAAKELARRGFHVLAGVRRDVDADALRADGIEPRILDITVDSDVAAIADRVTNDPRGRPLRALVNNAGVSVNAPVETLPISEWRRLFEVNLFGHVAMTQSLLPALRRSGGTVVNISSVGGKVALPTYGAYAGTKFALEAVSDSLRREVGGQAVKVVVVEPGAVKTEMLERGVANADRLKAAMATDQLGRYGDLVAAVSEQARSFGEDGVSAESAARVIATAVVAARPRTRYAIGRDAAVLVRLSACCPIGFSTAWCGGTCGPTTRPTRNPRDTQNTTSCVAPPCQTPGVVFEVQARQPVQQPNRVCEVGFW